MKKKIRILIADDDPGIRVTLSDILREKEYFVEVVKDGFELLANLKNKAPQIIILDLIMPEKDGIEIIPSIKSISPDVKIIIYTGFKKYLNSAYSRLANKFLLKGEDPGNLLEAIKDLIGNI